MHRILDPNPYIPGEFNKDNFYLCGKPHLPIRKSTMVNEIQTMFISSPPFGAIEEAKEKRGLKRRKKKLRNLKSKEIEMLQTKLVQTCLTHVEDTYQLHENRLKGLKIINVLAARVPLEQLPQENVMLIVWSILSCLHHFMLRIRPEKGFAQWIRRRQAKNALDTFDRLIYYLFPLYKSAICAHMISFFEEASLWEIDFFPSTLLSRLAANGESAFQNEVALELIKACVRYTESDNVQECFAAKNVLCEMLPNFNWNVTPSIYILVFVRRFYESLIAVDTHCKSAAAMTCKHNEYALTAVTLTYDEEQLESIMLAMLSLLQKEELKDDKVLVFGSVLVKVCDVYSKKMERRPFNVDILGLILDVLDSSRYSYSLLGHRVLHSYLDRSSNGSRFQSPQIFFRTSHYNIRVHKLVDTDKGLWRKVRVSYTTLLLKALLQHGTHKLYLEHLYKSACLIQCEVPCGYTASACACFAMSLQQHILENRLPQLQFLHCNRFHTLVLSLLSFVGYIYQANILQDYVDLIVDRRARYAPHLNPPLKHKYTYAQHHILYNKPDLFFEDWEVRYGLWRCFKRFKTNLVIIKKN